MMMAAAHAHPAVVRLRIAPAVNAPVARIRRFVGRSMTPSRENANPSAMAIAHA